MFLPEIKKSTPAVNGMPEILHLFAFRPNATRHLMAFTQEVMRGESEIPVGWREAIAARTSKANRCPF